MNRDSLEVGDNLQPIKSVLGLDKNKLYIIKEVVDKKIIFTSGEVWDKKKIQDYFIILPDKK